MRRHIFKFNLLINWRRGDMGIAQAGNNKIDIFENKPIMQALAIMAIPTIMSQLITLIYNVADTWFVGQTNNPYMVAASSLVATIFLMTTAVANLFGTGGGNLVVRLIGSGQQEEARKVASLSLVMAAGSAVLFSLLCLVFMNPLLRILGASDYTIGYAKQYLIFVVVVGSFPTILSATMSAMLRNIGYSKEAAFGLGFGGILNIILDPILMFVILPDGYEVMGAGIATMLSNMAALIYYVKIYLRVKNESILHLPRRIEKIQKSSMQSLFAVGLPASLSVLLYDLTNMVINMLSSSHGDLELAAIGIVLKVERLPLNIGIGICLGMVPLVAYNYAAKNQKRMDDFFKAARTTGFFIAVICVVMYYLCATYIINAFIKDAETVRLGIQFLKARCFATPFMFLSFHMVHFMNAIGKGHISLRLAIIRQLILNIPILFMMNILFGMNGIVWTQMTADIINVAASYVIYFKVRNKDFNLQC